MKVFTALPPELQISKDEHVVVDDDDWERAETETDDIVLHQLTQLRLRMDVMSYSTAFSGIDCPGTSFAQLRVAVDAALGKPREGAFHPAHTHAIDTRLTRLNCYESTSRRTSTPSTIFLV